jgi:hypothetical protein
MNDSVLKAQIDAAKAYEALFVPALFGQWATKVADTAQIKSGQRVLDVALLERLAGTQAAGALRAPFILGDRQTLAALFTDAGVSEIDITTHPGTPQFPSLPAMVDADLRGWLPVMGVVLTERQIDRIMQEAEDVLGSYLTAEGRVVFESPAHLVTAIKV